MPARTRTLAPVRRSRICVLDSALVAGRCQARSAASVMPRLAAVSSMTPPARVIAMVASFLRWSMKRWCTRTPLSSHIEVMLLAACARLSTTAPPPGSVDSSMAARAASAGLSGVTSTAARPSARRSASFGTSSVTGSSQMKRARPGSKSAAKVSDTSRAVMPGSTRWSSASRWVADIGGVSAVTARFRARSTSRAGRVVSRRTASSASATNAARASCSSRSVKPCSRARCSSVPRSFSMARQVSGRPVMSLGMNLRYPACTRSSSDWGAFLLFWEYS